MCENKWGKCAKKLMCKEKVREVCEKLRGMGRNEIWENGWEKCDKCEKKLEMLKNKMCEKKCKLACVIGSLYMVREVQQVLLIP